MDADYVPVLLQSSLTTTVSGVGSVTPDIEVQQSVSFPTASPTFDNAGLGKLCFLLYPLVQKSRKHQIELVIKG